MRLSVEHRIGDLTNDLTWIGRNAQADMTGVVRNGIRIGNTVAKDNAKRSAGAHGGVSKKGVRPYVRAFGYEMHGIRGGFGVYLISGEYGPDASKPQGNMDFERGSRNQPPHGDLARSADLMGPALQREVHELPDKWFWPGGQR